MYIRPYKTTCWLLSPLEQKGVENDGDNGRAGISVLEHRLIAPRRPKRIQLPTRDPTWWLPRHSLHGLGFILEEPYSPVPLLMGSWESVRMLTGAVLMHCIFSFQWSFQSNISALWIIWMTPYIWVLSSEDNLTWWQLTFRALLLKLEVHMCVVECELRCGGRCSGQKLRMEGQPFSSYSPILVCSKLMFPLLNIISRPMRISLKGLYVHKLICLYTAC